MKSSKSIEDRLSRLRWACNRTRTELDAPLIFFLENHYVDLSMTKRFSFERLLSSSDLEISDWLSGEKSPHDQGISDVIDAIKKMIPEQFNNPEAGK